MSRLVLEPEGRAHFLCPGCGMEHVLRVSGEGAWNWNGSLDVPTLAPSILFQSGHFAPGHMGRCWCDWKREHPGEEAFDCVRCHSFIRDGKIQFLADCTHALAGKTVDLPECADV